jgi:hypothetical protein
VEPKKRNQILTKLADERKRNKKHYMYTPAAASTVSDASNLPAPRPTATMPISQAGLKADMIPSRGERTAYVNLATWRP